MAHKDDIHWQYELTIPWTDGDVTDVFVNEYELRKKIVDALRDFRLDQLRLVKVALKVDASDQIKIDQFLKDGLEAPD